MPGAVLQDDVVDRVLADGPILTGGRSRSEGFFYAASGWRGMPDFDDTTLQSGDRPELPAPGGFQGRAVMPCEVTCPTCGARLKTWYWAPSGKSEGPWEDVEAEGSTEIVCWRDDCGEVVDLVDPDVWGRPRSSRSLDSA